MAVCTDYGDPTPHSCSTAVSMIENSNSKYFENCFITTAAYYCIVLLHRNNYAKYFADNRHMFSYHHPAWGDFLFCCWGFKLGRFRTMCFVLYDS